MEYAILNKTADLSTIGVRTVYLYTVNAEGLTTRKAHAQIELGILNSAQDGASILVGTLPSFSLLAVFWLSLAHLKVHI